MHHTDNFCHFRRSYQPTVLINYRLNQVRQNAAVVMIDFRGKSLARSRLLCAESPDDQRSPTLPCGRSGVERRIGRWVVSSLHSFFRREYLVRSAEVISIRDRRADHGTNDICRRTGPSHYSPWDLTILDAIQAGFRNTILGQNPPSPLLKKREKRGSCPKQGLLFQLSISSLARFTVWSYKPLCRWEIDIESGRYFRVSGYRTRRPAIQVFTLSPLSLLLS